MKKLILLGLAATLASSLLAQKGSPTPSASSLRFHVYRVTLTEPTYGLAKIKRMVRKIKQDPDNNTRMADKDFNGLPTEQKFTYVMIHGEDFSQNCNEMPAILDEDKKIFGHLPEAFPDQMAWSEKEKAFLHSHRGTSIGLIRATMQAHHRVGVNLKAGIEELAAYELIPDLISNYQRTKKDNDILTLLMLLMEAGKYEPFLASASHTKLYASESNWQNYLTANSENKQLILERATAYYKSRKM